MHIASLEDDVTQGQLIQSLLTEAGYRCTLYSSGRALLTALARPHGYDLLLVDWELPDITGFDVLRWIRSNLGHAIPVIFVTNRSQETDLAAALHAIFQLPIRQRTGCAGGCRSHYFSQLPIRQRTRICR
ncbi:MAG: response regulator [Pigmentiphaga sp.]|nr:response regulator [Pigmentiphaga sp.]